MSPPVTLRPGRLSLSDLRSIYRGAPVSLDPIARADVEAGAAALQALGADPMLSNRQQAGQGPVETSPEAARNGEQRQPGILRLILAIKLGSLGQGYSGVRWAVLERMAEMLSEAGPPLRDPLGGDPAIMARLVELLGEPAGAARGETALAVTSSERAALLSGTQIPAAFALAGLFEAERVLQSALVSSALAMKALGGHALGHPRVHKLHGYPGAMEVAAAIRSLSSDPLVDAASLEAPVTGSAPDWGPDIARMGACLDLLRQAGATLELAANAVSENRLVFWFTQQTAVGFHDTAPIALAADMIAAALREIGSLTGPRVAKLEGCGRQDASQSTGAAPAWDAMVASFIGENKRLACPAEGNNGPGNGRESGGSAGPRRLLPMAGSTTLLVAIELLAASPILDVAAVSGSGLDPVRVLLRASHSGQEGAAGMPAGGLPGAAELVRSGAVVQAAAIPLPSVAPKPQRKTPAPLGAGAKLEQSDAYARITKAV